MFGIKALETEGSATKTRNEFMDSLCESNAEGALMFLVESLLYYKPLVVLGACQYIQLLMDELELVDRHYIDMNSVIRGEPPQSWTLISENDDQGLGEPAESDDPNDYDAVRDRLLQEVSCIDFKVKLTNFIISALVVAEEEKVIFGLVDLLILIGDRLHFEGEVAAELAKKIVELTKIIQDQDAVHALEEIIPKLSEAPFILAGEAETGKSS